MVFQATHQSHPGRETIKKEKWHDQSPNLLVFSKLNSPHIGNMSVFLDLPQRGNLQFIHYLQAITGIIKRINRSHALTGRIPRIR